MTALAASHKVSIAGVLLYLVAALGLCSPDAVCRTRSSARTRTGIVRVDDHELSGEALARTFENQSRSGRDLPVSELPMPAIVVPAPLPSTAWELVAAAQADVPAVSGTQPV